jgi:hypothetical protein
MTGTRADGPATNAAPRADLTSFLADGGVLDLPLRTPAVEGVRVELDGPQFLHLESLGITTASGASPATIAKLATVTVSSWYQAYGEKFSARRLFDFENASGTQVHTTADAAPWLEISFDAPLDVDRIRLRNVSNGTWARAATIRVSVRASGEWHSVFDASSFVDDVTSAVINQTGAPPVDARSTLEAVVVHTIAARYAEARMEFEALELDPDAARRFKSVMNREVLGARRMEWTIHGPKPCFRYWTPGQKKMYTVLASTIAEELADLTPNVCFGFGAVLCVVRDGALIPHDDDLDIIVGFEQAEASTLTAALHRVEDFLRPRGYAVTGNFSAHRQVRWGGKAVDVFVGLFEDDVISWYPGARGALTRQMMFPPSSGSIYGVTVPLPRDPTVYLEKIYGPGWVSPDPNFEHNWDRKAYADQRRAKKSDSS